MRKKETAKKEVDTISVRVAQIGGEIKEIALEEGSTIEDALNAAGIDPNGGQRIRVDGETAELQDELEDGDYVTLSGKIKGGTTK